MNPPQGAKFAAAGLEPRGILYPPTSTLEEFNQASLQRMAEDDLQSHIIGYAAALGWKHYHTWRSDHSPSGFPDLELARAEPRVRIIKAELKRQGEWPTLDQIGWLDLYSAMGDPVESYLWRPEHLSVVWDILQPDWRVGDADACVFGLWSSYDRTLALSRASKAAPRHRRRAPRQSASARLRQ